MSKVEKNKRNYHEKYNKKNKKKSFFKIKFITKLFFYKKYSN